jgi:phospholipase C
MLILCLEKTLTLSALVSVALTLSEGKLEPAEPVLTSPISHVVVICGENISFDHYFGTYRRASNVLWRSAHRPASTSL